MQIKLASMHTYTQRESLLPHDVIIFIANSYSKNIFSKFNFRKYLSILCFKWTYTKVYKTSSVCYILCMKLLFLRILVSKWKYLSKAVSPAIIQTCAISKSTGHNTCWQCCSHDLCNDVCTPQQASTSPVPPTTTTTVATTQQSMMSYFLFCFDMLLSLLNDLINHHIKFCQQNNWINLLTWLTVIVLNKRKYLFNVC